jgi:hypothetical protein
MKTIFFAIAGAYLFTLLTVLLPATASAQIIKELNSKLNISASGNVGVVEDLKISFPAARQRNQFYRILPIWYEPWKTIHVVDVNVKSVVMDGKVSVPFQSWLSGRDLYLKVGDAKTPLKGDHNFRIEYEILKAVHFVNGNPQLFVNVTGEQCPFPIQKATVTVTFPKGTDMNRVKSSSFVGTNGTNKAGATQRAGGTVQIAAQNLKPAQGLTIVVDMPRGSVVPHSVLYDAVLYLQRFYQSLVLPVATMILLSAWWWIYGRDPGAKKNESTGWFPPDYITPAEAGTLIDESCDLKDLVSTLIDLAARGFINIRVLPYNGFLYLDNKDYEFTLLKSAKDRELKPHEQLFLIALFGGLSTTTYISAVKGNFVEYLPALKRRVYSGLVTDGLFARDPEIDRKNFLSAGAAIITVGISLMVISTYHAGGQATSIGTVLSGLVVLLAASAMPRRTSKGVTALAQLRRFQRMIVFGDKKELQKVAKETPEVFDKFLSYAIVLGLSDRWAAIFADTVREYPEWYQIDRSLTPEKFDARQFIIQLHDGFSIINRALTDLPQQTRTVNANTLMHSGHYHRH